MAYYLSADGGGTKLRVLLFDERFRAVAESVSGGVNTNFIPREIVRAHMLEAIEGVFRQAAVPEIERAYLTIVGPADLFLELLGSFARVKAYTRLSEAQCYLYAGVCKRTGAVLLSGTGSGAAYVQEGKVMLHLGGMGAWFGDEGSGYYIGRAGINAVTRALDGWGPETALTGLLAEYVGDEGRGRIITGILGDANPHRRIAGFCPSVSEAAKRGDPVALEILREAGDLLARQAVSLYRRVAISGSTPLVLSGGTFNCGKPLIDPILGRLGREAPLFETERARFHSVLGGPAMLAMEMDLPDIPALLSREFPQYIL